MMTRDMKKPSPQSMKELKDLNFTAYFTCDNACGLKELMTIVIKDEDR